VTRLYKVCTLDLLCLPPSNDVTALKKPPFRIDEDGWGEFELRIGFKELSGKTHEVLHDLNFQQEKYEVKHVINFKKPTGPMLDELRESGPIPGEAAINGDTGKKRASEIGAGGEKKRKKGGDSKGFDMDKLAEGLQKLNEDDLLQVVQMVHDNKSEESWMRNDVERKSQCLCKVNCLLTGLIEGEFHVDLYTLPDNLIKMLWEFTTEKNAVSAAA
jgi:transcription initiation factor TFIID/TFIIF subunit